MDAFIGIILPSPYNFVPYQWAWCNGAVLPVSQNAALFSLLGTTYGGNGVSNFGLPDLRGRVIVGSTIMGPGPGLGVYELGQMEGTETVTITVAELPPHTHPNTLTGVSATGSLPVSSTEGFTTPSATQILGSGSGSTAAKIYGSSSSAPATPLTVNVQVTGAGGANTGSTGGGQPTNNLQPYTALAYIIALYGIFPTRG